MTLYLWYALLPSCYYILQYPSLVGMEVPPQRRESWLPQYPTEDDYDALRKPSLKLSMMLPCRVSPDKQENVLLTAVIVRFYFAV